MKIIYDEEQEKWIASPDLELTNIDTKSTIKTNFLFVQRNFVDLLKWLFLLKGYVKYLRSLIDIDNILAEILDKIKREKTTIPIVYSMEIGQITTYTDPATKQNYKIRRVDEYNIQITNISDTEWFVDKLIVSVKNYDGTIVYPVIKTASNQINIYFTDGISTNYNVLFI